MTTKGLKLECTKPKCFNRQILSECKICVKSHKCELCKARKQHSRSTKCTKNRKCDACTSREELYQCVTKKYCSTCSVKKGKCGDCKELPPKCINNGKHFYIYIIKNFNDSLFDILECCARRLLSVQLDFRTIMRDRRIYLTINQWKISSGDILS